MRNLAIAAGVALLAVLAAPNAAAARTSGQSDGTDATRLDRFAVARSEVADAVKEWRDQVRQRATEQGDHGGPLTKSPWWSRPLGAGGGDDGDSGEPTTDEQRAGGKPGKPPGGKPPGGGGGKDDEEDDVSPSSPL
jgi:hypothetical protein